MRVPPPPFSDPRISHPKKRAFLAAFAVLGNVSRAAASAGIDRRTHTTWKTEDGDYADAFVDAREHGADALVEEAQRRAFVGSDTLLIFLLKGLRPEVYRERYEHTGKDGGAIQTEVFVNAKASLLEKLNKLAARASTMITKPEPSGRTKGRS